jgi:O-antigen ligase
MPQITGRLKLNTIAFNMISAHPIIGIGLNTFVEQMRVFDTTGFSDSFPQPVHNVYLLIAAETGLVGLGLFLILLLMIFRECLRSTQVSDPYLSACAIGIFCGLTVMAFSNLVDHHLKTEQLFALFWLLVGLILSLKEMRETRKPSVSSG